MPSISVNQLSRPTPFLNGFIDEAVGGAYQGGLVGIIAKVFTRAQNPAHPMDCGGAAPVLLRPTTTEKKSPFFTSTWSVAAGTIPTPNGNNNKLHIWGLFSDNTVVPCDIPRIFRTTPLSDPPSPHRWKLNEAAGTSAADSGSSATSITGTHQNGPAPAADVPPHYASFLRSLELDGSDDFVDVPTNSGDLDIAGDFTLALWTKWDTGGDFMLLARDMGAGAGMPKWILGRGIQTPGYLEFHINDAGLGNGVLPLSWPWTPSSDWHHIAVKREGTTWRLYIDAVEVQSNTDATPVPNPAVSMTIGAAEALPKFDGRLFDVRFFNPAVTDDVIRDLHDGPDA